MKLKKPTLQRPTIYKKQFLKLIFFVFLFFVGAKDSFAQEVTQSINAFYHINQNGRTSIQYEILLTNQTTDVAIQSYSLALSQTEPKNVEIFDQDTPKTPEVNEENGIYTIKTTFEDPTVGKGANRRLSINFTDDTLAEKFGNVWEVTLPHLKGKNFSGVVQTLTVPLEFGELAYISPEPQENINKDKTKSYIFSHNTNPQAITAAFGEFQVYSFGITYHLENPVQKETVMEIAIPPDTANQKIFYEKIDPLPENIKIDTDGNWIAQYTLKARETKEVKASGSVQIFSFSQKHLSSTHENDYLKNMLKPTAYWQSDDPAIKNLGQNLKTPRAIYEYVVNTLSYDYDRVRPEVKRMGALKALQNPTQAMCMEFTDLFIALSRAAGIPAREINGYAYTENPKLQPLSLVADVLHAWPQYWDEQKQLWISVDPTWGSTSGLNYFDKLDLNHFTFVTHGINPEVPYPPGSYKLGAHPQKDVYVSFSHLPEKRNVTPVISIEKGDNIGIKSVHYNVKLYNPGPTALYNKALDLEIDGTRSTYEIIDLLPPFMSREVTLKTPVGFFGSRAPEQIKVYFAGSEAGVKLSTSHVVMVSITAIFLLILLITAFLYWKFKKR